MVIIMLDIGEINNRRLFVSYDENPEEGVHI